MMSLPRSHHSRETNAMQRNDSVHTIFLTLGAAVLASACHSSSSSRVVVDGVALHERHSDTFALQDWGTVPVVLESRLGEIVVRAAEGPASVEVELIEKTLGDARAWFEDGRILAKTSSGEPYAIGSITITAPADVPALAAGTGMGSVVVEGMRVDGELALSSGMGDIRVEDTEAGGRVTLKTGMGSIKVAGLRSATLTAGSGMGSVQVEDAITGDGVLVSSMGSVRAKGSQFAHLQAKSGMGDVDVRGSSFSTSELSSGMGSVRSGQ